MAAKKDAVAVAATQDDWSSLSYEEMLGLDQTLDVVQGSDLQIKSELFGVPFIIRRVVFRGATPTRDYVSVEAVAKDKGNIVFNDGSTGIKRQIIEYLASRGHLSIPESDLDANPDQQIAAVDENIAFDILLHCPRGLRASEYTVESGPAAGETATTFYLA
jgi:hypothetical protein